MRKQIATLILAASLVWAGERIVVRPQDTGAALVNPGMGWHFIYHSNLLENYGSKLEPADTLDDFPGLSTVYLRLPWSYIKPEEGKFNWSVVDTPAQRSVAKGKQVAFRFTCTESGPHEPPHIMNWVECLRSRQRPNADVFTGHYTAAACHMGNLANERKVTIRWNEKCSV